MLKTIVFLKKNNAFGITAANVTSPKEMSDMISRMDKQGWKVQTICNPVPTEPTCEQVTMNGRYSCD